MSEKLLVGFGRTDITPEESVPLRGYGSTSNRMSDHVLNPLAATCLAFTDAKGETILVYSLDLCTASSAWLPRFAPAISKATGVPADHVFASATHNHSSPDTENLAEPSIPRYLDLMEVRLVEAGKAAMADRKEADMFTAIAETRDLNFVRRYILEDGTPAGDNYGRFDLSPIKCHETEPDRSMRFVKFVREGKKDILMVNFQTHPHRTGNGGKFKGVSSDIVGVMRDETEQRLGCDFIYFTGGSGNVNPRSRIEAENNYADHWEQGKAMADVAVSVEGTYKPVPAGTIKVEWNVPDWPADHTQDHRVKEATYIHEGFTASGDRPTWTAEARKLGFNSVYHAASVIKKSGRPATLRVPLAAAAAGSIGFAMVPYEMFDTNGAQVKEQSPFDVTFVLTCANEEHMGYVPSALGNKNGGYSTDSGWFVPGSGEKFADALIDSLKKIHG